MTSSPPSLTPTAKCFSHSTCPPLGVAGATAEAIMATPIGQFHRDDRVAGHRTVGIREHRADSSQPTTQCHRAEHSNVTG